METIEDVRKNDIPAPDPFGDLDLPVELEESLQRHREDLKRLVAALRAAGMSEARIEESVSVMVASYRDELVRVMKMSVR